MNVHVFSVLNEAGRQCSWGEAADNMIKPSPNVSNPFRFGLLRRSPCPAAPRDCMQLALGKANRG